MPKSRPKLIDTERYKRLVDTSNDLIWALDTEGRFTFVNDAAALRIYGYAPAEMIGRPLREFMTEEQAEKDLERLARIKVDDPAFNYRTVHRRKDGSAVPLSFNAVADIGAGGVILGTTGTARDLSEVVHYTEELKRSEERYRLLFENSTEPIGVVQDGHLVFFNHSVLEATGYSAAELRQTPFVELIHPDDRPTFAERSSPRPPGEELSPAYVLRITRKSGEVRHMNLSGVQISWEGRPAILNFLSDVTVRESAQADLEFQAYHDPLTGLPNRALFADRLNQALARARRYNEPVAVLYADLDRLKKINDSLGHSIGDLLLKQAADRFRSVIRQEDTVARFGGDEFVVLLTRVRDSASAAKVAEKLLVRMDEPMLVGGHTLRVTTSIGMSLWPTDGTDGETLIKNADKALYRAKEAGRNTFRLFTAEMNEKAQQRLALEQALVRTIAESGFTLVYQAQHDLRSGRVVGYEAFVRWNDKVFGEVDPATFISVAEDTRLIEELGDFVLDRALRDARRFPKGVRLAVNVSAVQLRDPKFPGRVSQLLAKHDLPAPSLELEITERATLADDALLTSTLAELKRLGVRMAVDDFGTGYASLSQLRTLSADVVKIDRSFIAGVAKKGADSAIVIGIMGMAHCLNVVALAEGVETEEQRDFLTTAGCDVAQGFFFGRPAPIDDLGLPR